MERAWNASTTARHPAPWVQQFCECALARYLWEQVWQRDSWLEILGRYLVTQRDSKKNVSGFIFPRYHQLDATRKLVAAVLQEGAGHKYLIQHSAGSGKTNSIAWTAHFLADLHDANNHKLFDSVLVVSDRNVLDAQQPLPQRRRILLEHGLKVLALKNGLAGKRRSGHRYQLCISDGVKRHRSRLIKNSELALMR